MEAENYEILTLGLNLSLVQLVHLRFADTSFRPKREYWRLTGSIYFSLFVFLVFVFSLYLFFVRMHISKALCLAILCVVVPCSGLFAQSEKGIPSDGRDFY